jgi:hypothetical protein
MESAPLKRNASMTISVIGAILALMQPFPSKHQTVANSI